MTEKEFICPICGKIFNETSCKKPKASFNKHIPFCTWRKKLLDGENLNVEEIEKLLDKYGSVCNLYEQIKEKYGGSLSWCYKLFKE